MKGYAIFACVLALLAASCTEAIRTEEFIDAVLEHKSDSSFLHPIASLLGGDASDKKPEQKGAYALVKFIVKPSLARGFIEAFEKSKEGAEKFDGYIGYYLVKTVDDNITYVSWSAWKSPEDLIRYIKSDDARELIEYTAKEDIVTLISGVRPIA